MSYALLEIEITQPLQEIVLEERHSGIAIIARYRDRPIGFWIEERPNRNPLTVSVLASMLSRELREKILQEKLREEIVTNIRGHFPSLSVAICTKDRPDNLNRCLHSLTLLNWSLLTSSFEILVIDNAPSDSRTKDVAYSYGTKGVRYACEPKPGLDFARNRAIAEATGEILAFLDDDIVVDRGWLNGLIESWTANPDAGGVTGLVLPYELETEAQIAFEKRGGFRRGFDKIRYGQTLRGNKLYPGGSGIFGAGCNMSFRRELLLKLNGFDEALDTGKPLPGGGDLDIFYRTIRAGHPLIYEPTYLVYHQHRREIAQLRHQYWSWGLGFMTFVAKSYQQDKVERSKLRRLVWWWFFVYQPSILLKSFIGLNSIHPSMVLAEVWGGAVGLLGEYQRSHRRIQAIRTRFGEADLSV